jgi:hypothetical protein
LFASSLAAVLLAAGCGGSHDPENADDSATEALSIDRLVRLPASMVNMGQIVYGASSQAITINNGETHGYIFKATKGDAPQFLAGTVFAATTATLFGPASLTSIGPQIAIANGAPGQNAVLRGSIPTSGVYVFTVTTSGASTYSLFTSCSNTISRIGCLPNAQSPMSFGTSRITQAAIDRGRYKPAEIFAVGDFLFDHNYTLDEGWGNALTNIGPGGPNPRPNLRQIHNGKFGGPDSNNCARCHLIGGHDGGGDIISNLFQDGDGVNASSALVRNPPQLVGVGYLQQLGIEMTADLAQQLSAAQAAAASSGTAQTVALTSKGVSFGSITVPPAGTPIDFSQLQGIDQDLVVKPLGWKGRVASARRFVEGGFQVHLGMQTEPIIAKNCKTPIPDVVGTGPNCNDPDMDGVTSEITEGQLTAMATYATMLQAPVRNDPSNSGALARVRNGELLFNQLGCASCHQTSMELNNPIHFESPDLTGGPPLEIDLTVDGKPPQLTINGDGVVVVELFSDLKRHAMGSSLKDPHPTFGTIAADQFMTPPLWGVAATAPYLHDGRAPSLFSAIVMHDGEGLASAQKFQALQADSQQMVFEFLGTLGRDPAHVND